jgi:hypothetical protein
MFLDPYHTSNEKKFQFTRQQASHFAKIVAGDFNPIHDEDNKRFCVPGDLLFAVLLEKEGISQKMSFTFSGMVNDGVELHIQEGDAENSALVDAKGKEYLHMTHSGEVSKDSEFIEHLVKNYVKFSGMNFPHIMVPLMEEAQMMININRPLVMYQNMEVEFFRFDLTHPEVEYVGATFDVNGKRGVVNLSFNFKENDIIVGKGTKKMMASGLVPYDQEGIDSLVSRFNELKDTFIANN